MRLSKKNLLIRWAYIWDDETPDKTNICIMFWRAFFAVPLFGLFAGIILLFVAVVIGPFYGIDWLLKRSGIDKRVETKWQASLIRQRLLDFKNKTCTLIELD